MVKQLNVAHLLLSAALIFSTAGLRAQSVFINEIHYDNAGADTDEAFEVAGPTGTDLTGWSVVLYNGNGGAPYSTIALSGTIPDQDNGFGTLSFAAAGMQNGAPDGLALVDAGTAVVQFLSYEGSFLAVGGPADGLSSIDIGILESGSDPIGNSLQLAGSGQQFADFSWTMTTSTFGTINSGQSFGGSSGGSGGGGDPAVPITTLFVNEIHYDNTGADQDEGIEVAGTAGGDLTGYSLVMYNGANGLVYNIVNLSGIIPSQQSGFGTVFFPIAGLQNGAPDGFALVDPMGAVVQFLSYEGVVMALDGPAVGTNSTDIGVIENGSGATGLSLQLQGAGSSYADFTWAENVTSTYGVINEGQTFIPPVEVAFINEIHYDNAGADVGEAIEIAGTAGLDLTGWSLVLYNGSGGATYNTTSLSGIIPNQENGFGTLAFSYPSNGLQNGSPDGVALVNSSSEVVQFLSYEGVFVAAGGPADGLTSEDIAVAETTSTPEGFSLQLTGSGFAYTDFAWATEQANTIGSINTGQSFGGDPGNGGGGGTLELITISEARSKTVGAEVIVQGVLTATDQLAGPAYLQDATGGIAVFDSQVHGAGAFNIGDEIKIQGSIGSFGQMVQVVDVTGVELISAGNVVAALPLTIDQLGAHEGELVILENVNFDGADVLFYPNANYAVTDITGATEVRIDADVESLVGKLKPAGATSVTGVLGSYNGSHQLLPRFEADVPDATPYEAGGSDIPAEQTLDVVTWNMEFFGTTIATYGPSDVALQKTNAALVLDALNADIIAVQEVSETNVLDELLLLLDGYARVCSDVYSYSFEPADPNFPAQKLCFIYNTNTVTITDEKILFEQFYTDARTGVTTDMSDYPTGSAQSFWASGRLPYMVTADVNINGVQQSIRFINIHAKSGAAASDVARKGYDAQALKDTLDTYYPNDKIILLGDHNDDMDESIGGGTTPYEPFVLDAENYDPVTSSLSVAGFRSYLFADNMIDHVTISDELFYSYVENSASTFIPFNLVTNYSNTTSDHLPVLTRFELVETLQVAPLAAVELLKGYGEQSAVVEPVVTGGAEPYQFLWSDGSTEPTFTVTTDSPLTMLEVTISDASGQVVVASTTIDVEDVTCSYGNGRSKQAGVSMCNGKRTICIPEHLVEQFLTKGWLLGECENRVTRHCRSGNDPWRNKQSLYFDFSVATNVTVNIYNERGRLVGTDEIMVAEGASEYDVELPHKGLFYVKLADTEGQGFQATFRMIKWH